MAGTYLDAQNVIVGGPIVSATDHQNKLESFLVRNIDAPAIKSTYRLIKVGSRTETDDGATTWNTSSVTDGPSKRLQAYNSALSVDIDVALCFYGASEPSSAYRQGGMLWYDTTLNHWRTWRASGKDPLAIDVNSTGGGWHPIRTGYELWFNNTAGTIAQGKAVVHDTAGVRYFGTTTAAKNQAVVGVVVSSAGIAAATWGVLAVVGAQGGTQVYANVSNGAVAVGDLLVCGEVAGECQTAGPRISGTYVAATTRAWGTQTGAFAMAMEATAVDGLIKAQMIGYVGEGLKVVQSTTASLASPTKVGAGTGTWVEGNVSASLITTKHAPVMSATLQYLLVVTTAGGNDPVEALAHVTASQASNSRILALSGRSNGANECKYTAYLEVPLTNDTAAPTKPGTKFATRVILTTGASVDGAASMVGYVC